ncbi:MAG: hypothetical protein V3T58_03065 [Candidatus Hydrothermarchaeales archaeon]
MKCACGREYTVYDLFPRSYRLYVYFCSDCMSGFLAHHFDLNLEIYNLGEVGAKRFDGILFITGLKLDPRVFEFGIEGNEKEAVVVVDDKNALGELAEDGNGKYVFAPYSEKTEKRLKELLNKAKIEEESLVDGVVAAWRKAR